MIGQTVASNNYENVENWKLPNVLHLEIARPRALPEDRDTLFAISAKSI